MTHSLDNDNDKKITIGLDEENLENGLRAALHRQDCPEAVTLGEYQMGLLPAEEAAQLKIHLDLCPCCQAELARLTEFLAEDEVVPIATTGDAGPDWSQGGSFEWRRIKETGQILIRLLDDALDEALAKLQQTQPLSLDQLITAGPYRGRKTLLKEKFKTVNEDAEPTLTLETDPDEPGFLTVRFDVDISGRKGWPNLGGTEIILQKDGGIVASAITDSFGHAVFEDIPIEEVTRYEFVINRGSSPD